MQNKFSDRLKELIKNENITQKQFATSINVSQACVTYWIKSERQPTAEAIYSIAQRYNVTADYLLGLSDY
ncbi:MAG: helix-turn-helix domain-containing protein [Christensenellales bacterium]